jgi:hypothetical protein
LVGNCLGRCTETVPFYHVAVASFMGEEGLYVYLFIVKFVRKVLMAARWSNPSVFDLGAVVEADRDPACLVDSIACVASAARR